jgi:hypothetical protein
VRRSPTVHAHGDLPGCAQPSPSYSKATSVRAAKPQAKGANGDPSRIRTCNPRSRNPLLYPVELWDRWRPYNIANMKNPLLRQAVCEPFPRSRRQTHRRGTVAFVRPATQCCAAGVSRRGNGVLGFTTGFGLYDKCRMRPFRSFVPPPRVRHRFTHFCSIRGDCPQGAPS